MSLSVLFKLFAKNLSIEKFEKKLKRNSLIKAYSSAVNEKNCQRILRINRDKRPKKIYLD